MKSFGDFITFLLRIALLYIVFMLCRAAFWVYNADLIGPMEWSEVPSMLKGALIFDSGSIFYINLPFLLFSLLPLRIRGRGWYQKGLMWLFVAVNSAGLMLDMADIFYYPYKLARIASDDLHFVTNGNFGSLVASFLADYWYGVIGLGAVVWLLWFGFGKIPYRPTIIRRNVVYYTSQSALLVLSSVVAVVLIRGGNISPATYPISVSDASLYAAPSKTAMVLSNPFCLIRTIGQKSIHVPEYFSQEEADGIFSPVHTPADSSRVTLEGTPDIIILILESFGAAHLGAGYTPFLDSLIREGYAFTNAYHNGIRSIDALPSIWSSIPSFRTQFLSLPQSTARKQSLPLLLKERGYGSAFLHGAVRESMSFVAFGRSVGVDNFFSLEDYEAVNGHGDYDGKWGIWDHKFLPFAAEKISGLQRPFIATLFTLSSHHPYQLPFGFEGRYPEGNMEIHKMLGYTDEALRNFFARLSSNEWYDDALFIITADHGSGADNEKYLKVPYNFAVPLVFYSPSGRLRGRDERPAGHIDVMPTVLGMLGYDKPYFAFGKDLFSGSGGYTMNYMGAFNAIGDSLVYIFDGQRLSGAYDYRNDPLQSRNLADGIPDSDPGLRWTKAFIQQYYTRVRDRNFSD